LAQAATSARERSEQATNVRDSCYERLELVEVRMSETYVVCALSDIPSQRAKGFHLGIINENGEPDSYPIVIVRWGRQVFGYRNKCPHHGAHLDWERDSFLDESGQRLMCGKHGSLFEIGTGRCSSGPCKGEHLEKVRLEVIDGDICVLGLKLIADEAP
jgi:nitrite reductase/ring-hydroxylating ferredoxin subunit